MKQKLWICQADGILDPFHALYKRIALLAVGGWFRSIGLIVR